MTEMKPCPFCGSSGETEEYIHGPGWFIGCSRGGCTGHRLDTRFQSEESAVEAWNTRFIVTEARENEWLEDELMEVMRIVAKGMTDTHEDEIIYAMMVTAIRRLMEADTDKYEALFERWQKRHAAEEA